MKQKNKTAVEWLEEHIKNVSWIDKKLSERMDIIQQAKEMEKNQIEDAYEKGYTEDIPYPVSARYYKMNAEQYYNETYKNKEQ